MSELIFWTVVVIFSVGFGLAAAAPAFILAMVAGSACKTGVVIYDSGRIARAFKDGEERAEREYAKWMAEEMAKGDRPK